MYAGPRDSAQAALVSGPASAEALGPEKASSWRNVSLGTPVLLRSDSSKYQVTGMGEGSWRLASP